jgi:hypothetical protein
MFKVDPDIYQDTSFEERQRRLDDLEVWIAQAAAVGENPASIQQAYTTRDELQAADQRLFERLRQAIRSGKLRGEAFYDEIKRLVNLEGLTEDPIPAGFDSLDDLITGILLPETAPEAKYELSPGMIYYEPTPARVIFKLVRQLNLINSDVFYDLGSGLGHVSALVHLLTGARAVGVEIDPDFSSYASRQAMNLNLPMVTYLNQDARLADYSCGTIFFMYTPFEGKVLNTVLRRLRGEAIRRSIQVCTAGFCVYKVADCSWLTPLTPVSEYYLTVFSSK